MHQVVQALLDKVVIQERKEKQDKLEPKVNREILGERVILELKYVYPAYV